MVERTTLLKAVWENGGNVEDIRARLESGELVLTGNFKGQEAEIVAEAGDWERK
jgi:hypothetical protein